MQGLMNFNCDYASRAVNFSSITTTVGWSRKPQPLLKLHMHEQRRISIWYHCLFVCLFELILYVTVDTLYLKHAGRDVPGLNQYWFLAQGLCHFLARAYTPLW